MADHELPIRMGSPEELARLRGYFRDTGFDSDAIYGARLFLDNGKPDLASWHEVRSKASPGLRLAIELFFRGDAVSEQDFRAACEPDVYATLRSLGMLVPRPEHPDQLVGSVWIYPLDGFVIVSDRFEDPDGQRMDVPDDVTFCALNDLTLRFLLILPDARGGDALDLCGGCGIGALRLARNARTSASADVTVRAAFYADFNARLNGVEMASLCGDLYDPAGDRQFDVISAHPPFIPQVGSQRMIFRDADAFGESIARRIVERLPERLRVGGTGVVVFAGWDGAKPLELRIQEWLGDAAASFDLVFGEYSRKSIEEVVANIRRVQRDVPDSAIEAFVQNLRNFGAEHQVYGAAMFRHLAASAPQPPLRLKLTERASGHALQRVLDWRETQQRPDFVDCVSIARPRGSAQLEMNARYAMRDGKLALTEIMFETSRGILGKLKVDPWLAPSIMRLNGTSSVAEVYAAARDAEALPQGFEQKDFAGLVGLMLARGFLDTAPPGYAPSSN